MNLRVLFILFFVQVVGAQSPLPALLDSLAQATSSEEKARLGMGIATELASEDWERALNYMDLAKKNALKSVSQNTLADFYIALGDIYFTKDALDIALGNYLKAYEYTKEDSENSYTYDLESKLAILYGRIKEEEKARDFFRKVYNRALKNQDSSLIAKTLHNIGTTYLFTELDSAKFYYSKSAMLLEKVKGELPLKSYLYANLGRVYFQKDSLKKAQEYFMLSANIINEDDKEPNRAAAWVNNTVAFYYSKINKPDSAIVYALNANRSLQDFKFSFENQNSLQILYNAYLKKEDFKNAARYFIEYDEVRDSLNIEEKSANVEKIKIEQEYKNKRQIQELENSKRQFKNYILFLILLAFLLILTILLIKFRNKFKNSQLEKQLVTAQQEELNIKLQLKNKELIGKAMIEMHRTEIIEDILKDLKEIKVKAVRKETQKAIDFIATRLKRDITSNIWEEFELRFEQVHESFYKNLLKEHSDLTPGDKRLCALLKLNLTSKEITQITGQSIRAVENARTRLRRKMNITNSQTDLSTYLSSFD